MKGVKLAVAREREKCAERIRGRPWGGADGCGNFSFRGLNILESVDGKS